MNKLFNICKARNVLDLFLIKILRLLVSLYQSENSGKTAQEKLYRNLISTSAQGNAPVIARKLKFYLLQRRSFATHSQL